MKSKEKKLLFTTIAMLVVLNAPSYAQINPDEDYFTTSANMIPKSIPNTKSVNNPVSEQSENGKQNSKQMINAKGITLNDLMETISKMTGISYFIYDYPDFDQPISNQSTQQNQVQDDGLTPSQVSRVIITDANAMLNDKPLQPINNKDNNNNKPQISGYLKNLKVNFVYWYDGNVEKLIKNMCDSLDLYCQYDKKENIIRINRYETLKIDNDLFYDYSIEEKLDLASSSNSTSSSNSNSTTSSTTNSASDSSSGDNFLSYKNKYNEMFNNIKTVLSSEGQVIQDKSGFLYVIDHPSKIKIVRDILEEQKKKTESLYTRVDVYRIDYDDTIETGIDFSKIWSNGNKEISWNGSGGVTSAPGVLTMKLPFGNVTNLIKALENYGKVNIVHSWELKSKLGLPLVFRDTESIPYVVPEVTSNQSSTDTTYVPNFAEVGLKINILQTRDLDNGSLEGTIFTEFSTLVSMDQFATGSNTPPVSIPHTKGSKVAIPFQVKPGESIVLTGFRIKSTKMSSTGIPLLSKIPILGNLFGYKSDGSANSELIIVFTPIENKEINRDNYTIKVEKQ